MFNTLLSKITTRIHTTGSLFFRHCRVQTNSHAAIRHASSSSTTHFGFQTVPTHEKQERVAGVFSSVADNYDVMNDFMSAGIHRHWKDALLDASGVAESSRLARSMGAEYKILDVAGGTGDVAFRFVAAADCVERNKSSGADPVQITVCDINAEMLRVGRDRAARKFGPALLRDHGGPLQFVQGNAQDLSFPNNQFDLYTIAFGLRNVTHVDMALREAYRVLKPGGMYMCLEFSQVPNPIVRAMYDAYSFNVIPILGLVVANDRASYQYLVESIRQFSNQEELCEKMRKAGFTNVKYTNMTGGVVALHQGWKPLE
jgi:ubiquinone/menaquinone biosynthesis methyltransferase